MTKIVKFVGITKLIGDWREFIALFAKKGMLLGHFARGSNDVRANVKSQRSLSPFAVRLGLQQLDLVARLPHKVRRGWGVD